MKTIILKADNARNIRKASRIIKHGGLVAFPTETVYGLGGNALSPLSAEKIYAAKGRPSDNPLIVHIGDTDDAFALSDDIPESFFKLAEAFWPGPLTMIVKKNGSVPAATTGGLDSVAIRMPSDKTALSLIRETGLPIAAPSANSSGKPSPTEASHVYDDLNGKIPLILDGGSCSFGVESTVLTLVPKKPILLRPGAVTKEMIESVIGEIEVSDAVINPLKEGEAAASPGMKYKHYSPSCEVYLFEGSSEEYIRFLSSLNNKDGAFALCFTEDSENIPIPFLTYGAEKDEKNHAEKLFSCLREFDKLGAKTVYAHSPSKDGLGLAVYNRLIRAAGFKVVGRS